MPSRYSVGRGALDDVYETMLATVKDQILTETPRHVSITFDLWTDQYRRHSYITFTLHFITAGKKDHLIILFFCLAICNPLGG